MEQIKTSPKLRTHIIPVGFEIERVTLAAVELRADRIYLITKEGIDVSRRLCQNCI